ncbi:MAG: TolC family protein [Ignavibacteria bacterium]|nr:TolC family protein [Ignavibacteria bacterium]
MKSKLVLAFLFVVNFLFGQELSLSYDELISLVLENNLTIKYYREKLNQSKLKEDEIFYSTLPQLKFSGRYSRLSEIEPFIIQLPFVPGSPSLRVYEPVEEQYFTRLSVEFPLFTGLRQVNSIKAQKKFVQASDDELKQITNETIFKAKELYLKLFLAYKSLSLIEANIQYLEEQKKNVEKFFENGLVQENDVLKIDIALNQAKVKFFEQQNLINSLNNALCLILNLDLQKKIIPSFNIEEKLKEDFPQSFSTENKPEISAIKNIIKANEYLKTSMYGSLYPNIFFNAGYDYAKPNPKFFPVKNEWKYSWDVNLVFQFTIWDWLLPINKANQIELQIKQNKYLLNQLIKKSEIEVSDLLNRIENEKQKKVLFEKEVIFTKENLRITENKFNQGLATSTDLLDANRQKVEAEIKLTESKINLILLREEYKKLCGTY